MAQKLENWLIDHVAKCKEKGENYLANEYFFRDPHRPTHLDNKHFFSPADGIILYQKVVKPDEQIVEIKGINYSLKELLSDKEFNTPCLVVGVFMTYYDVHINRIPYSGYLNYFEADPIESHNKPMLAIEKGILAKELDLTGATYMALNQRMVNNIYAPSLSQDYYVVQIGDYDVDVITHWSTAQGNYFNQTDRFSMIRFGSQCDLIIPIYKDLSFDFEFVNNVGDHVEAGIDPLVKIIGINDPNYD